VVILGQYCGVHSKLLRIPVSKKVDRIDREGREPMSECKR
jgi:hypothetical protein